MRVNAVRGAILVSAMLTAAFVPLVTSSHAAFGVSVSSSAVPAASASASPLDPASPSSSPTPTPSSTGNGSDEWAEFYRSVLDVRPDLPGITARQYYAIGRAFCTSDELSTDQFVAIQQAYAMPAATLAYDPSIATAMVEAAPMGFVEQNQGAFGFSVTDLDTATLNAFRLKLCHDPQLWLSYARFVLQQLGSLGPWQSDPAYGDPAVAARLWRDDLAAWESALGPWLPSPLPAS